MAVSPSFLTWVTEQLGRVAPAVRARRMFGGAGIYSADRFFALVDDEQLYLKVDDETRPSFEALGLGPFRPYGEGGETMAYHPVPDGVLDDVEALRPWVEAAIAVAERAKATKGKRRRG